MKNMLKKLDAVADKQLRSGGLVFAIIGFIIIWYSKPENIYKISLILIVSISYYSISKARKFHHHSQI